MAEIVSSETIEGVHVVTPDVYGDDRGFFVETYRFSTTRSRFYSNKNGFFF